MLTADERFLFNKLFLKVKKNYLEVYGFDNRQVSNEDVVNFINAIAARPAQGTTAEEVLKTLAEEDSKKKYSNKPFNIPINNRGAKFFNSLLTRYFKNRIFWQKITYLF